MAAGRIPLHCFAMGESLSRAATVSITSLFPVLKSLILQPARGILRLRFLRPARATAEPLSRMDAFWWQAAWVNGSYWAAQKFMTREQTAGLAQGVCRKTAKVRAWFFCPT